MDSLTFACGAAAIGLAAIAADAEWQAHQGWFALLLLLTAIGFTVLGWKLATYKPSNPKEE